MVLDALHSNHRHPQRPARSEAATVQLGSIWVVAAGPQEDTVPARLRAHASRKHTVRIKVIAITYTSALYPSGALNTAPL